MNKYKLFLGTVLLVTLVWSCGEKKQEEQQIMNYAEVLPASLQKTSAEKPTHFGEEVPSHLVCMVNDRFMGVQQLEVQHDGKTYYGCCEMCQTRIPQDPKVRQALDPYSLKTVDKAEAYIVSIGKQGQVAYFENKENFENFVKEGAK